MPDSAVRILSLEINDFKNVTHGYIDMSNPRKNYSASILGLYGQNGSGKTALIDALSLLKYALTGRSVPASYADYVNVDAESARFRYTMKVDAPEISSVFTVIYEFSLKKDADEYSPGTGAFMTSPSSKATIFDEVLSYSCSGEKSFKTQPVVDTRCDDVFVPVTKYKTLVGGSRSAQTDLIVAKKFALATSRSFIFSKELLESIRRGCDDKYHLELFEDLIRYGNFRLFIIDTTRSGMLTMDTLPLNIDTDGTGNTSSYNVLVDLNGPALIPEESCTQVKRSISNMNIVLSQIIPGFEISVKDLGTELLPNGSKGIKIQLMSEKNSKAIPLRYESEGIKKIVSVIQLLIIIYNDPSVTVAIDELDSGVFEYLLGELLHIISEKGKGQLIFTSHNLRPLETLDRGFIAFTTTNPSNRYMRMSNVKTNNNLRDFYYRDIVLGEQSEPVYEPTNSYEIALAFREAGEPDGT